MRERKFSYKVLFVIIFVVVLAAAIISESNTAGGLVIKRAGTSESTVVYKNICVDTDEGNADYANIVGETYIKQLINGQVYVIRREYDVCTSPSTVQEYYCIGDLVYSKTEYCSEGCKNGACKPCLNCNETQELCMDSDGGKMFYLTGVVTVNAGNSDNDYKDYCVGNIVREGYCLNGQFAWIWKTCPKDCYNGACLTG